MKRLEILDTTLRDGAQAEGISFTTKDKIEIVKILDDFGIDLIECGNPHSNPKDVELFRELSGLKLNRAKIVVFGSTRRKALKVRDDANIKAIVDSKADIVSLVGKSSLYHVEYVLKTTAKENLAMIRDSVSYLAGKGKTVYFDCEHFFDAYKSERDYAVETAETALDAGAECAVLCDTNGSSMPWFVSEAVKAMCEKFPDRIGVHFHEDKAMGLINTLESIKAGAFHVQGTFTGFGERLGNAALAALLPIVALEFPERMPENIDLEKLTRAARNIAEVSGHALAPNLPFVGDNAFAHKGGMHIDAVLKSPLTYEHISPESVGNDRRYLLSDVSGRGALLKKASEFVKIQGKEDAKVKKLIAALKNKEQAGYQYEGADASFELFIRQTFGMFDPPYKVELYRVLGEKTLSSTVNIASAIVKVRVGDKTEIAAGEGNGPVNALDMALRRALESFFPKLKTLYLTDYKVRVIDPDAATGAKVRVMMRSTNEKETFSTIGVSTDVIDASFKALLDAFAYHLSKV